jgi:hypothetical protein
METVAHGRYKTKQFPWQQDSGGSINMEQEALLFPWW